MQFSKKKKEVLYKNVMKNQLKKTFDKKTDYQSRKKEPKMRKSEKLT